MAAGGIDLGKNQTSVMDTPKMYGGPVYRVWAEKMNSPDILRGISLGNVIPYLLIKSWLSGEKICASDRKRGLSGFGGLRGFWIARMWIARMNKE
jgi:hypothetical protein